MELTDIEKQIIKDMFNKIGVVKLNKKYNIDIEHIKYIWDNNKEYRRELLEKRNKNLLEEYRNLGKESLKCLRNILNMSHMVDVFDNKNKVIGKKADASVLKLKKEIGERILEDLHIMTPQKKGGGIMINQFAGKGESDAVVIEHKNDIKSLLNKCRLDNDEVNEEWGNRQN